MLINVDSKYHKIAMNTMNLIHVREAIFYKLILN